MANTKQWKTLGINTASRIWVTCSDNHTVKFKTNINPLTLSGQSLTPTIKQTRLSFWTGRIFASSRIFIQLILSFIIIRSFAVLALRWAPLVILALTTTPPQQLFFTFLVLGLALSCLWYKLLQTNNRWSTFVGGLALTLVSSASILFKSFSVFGVAFQPQKLQTNHVLNLYKFANANKVTLEQKHFVFLNYKILSTLTTLEPITNQLPKAANYKTTTPTFTPMPRLFKAFLSTQPLNLLKNWPNLTNDKVQVLLGKNLLLYQWSNSHAELAKHLSNSALWHSHRSNQNNLALLKLKSLPILSKHTLQTQQTCNEHWLSKVLPTPLLTTYVLNSALMPVRYDLVQHLNTSSNPLWSFSAKKI